MSSSSLPEARQPSASPGRALAYLLVRGGLGGAMRRVNAVEAYSPETLAALRGESSNVLFDRFPRLAERIPWRPLGRFPTPIEEVPRPGPQGARMFVKRDDLSSPSYGGNKVRKLEHFLAEAGLASRRSLITMGGIGSNHALATAIHGGVLGFDVHLVLYDQPITPHVRANLGGFLAAGARLHHAGGTVRAFLAAHRIHSRLRQRGEAPYFIMVGGSSRLGCIGHVTAGLELGQQVAAGEIPEPDEIFVPLGTCGTAAGLLVGVRLAGLRSRVVAVRVADPLAANPLVLRFLASDVAEFLRHCDPEVPHIRIGPNDFGFVAEHYGAGYGHPTAAGGQALDWATAAGIALDPTYTAKTMAACLDFSRACGGGRTVLFWNTFNSAPVAAPDDWDGLPRELHHVRTP